MQQNQEKNKVDQRYRSHWNCTVSRSLLTLCYKNTVSHPMYFETKWGEAGFWDTGHFTYKDSEVSSKRDWSFQLVVVMSCVGVLLLLLTTHQKLSGWKQHESLPYSYGGQKSKVSLTRLKSRCWWSWLLKASGENLSLPFPASRSHLPHGSFPIFKANSVTPLNLSLWL